MKQKGLVKLLVNLKFCEETFIRSKRGPQQSPLFGEYSIIINSGNYNSWVF